jgi:hypothetical protein
MLANDRAASVLDATAQVLPPFGYALLAAGGSLAVVRLRSAQARPSRADAADATVFAVDRGNGNVLVYLSVDEAERKMSVYSVEDAEFDFYGEDGTVLEARVVQDRNVISATEGNRRDDLLAALRAFVQRRGIDIGVVAVTDWDEEPDWDAGRETIGGGGPDGELEDELEDGELEPFGDDPLDYAAAIREWQWRELWPPWLRPFSPIFRRLAGG